MSPKKIFQLFLINLLIIIANVSVFSKAFLGFSLLFGSTLSMSVAWFTLLGSITSFAYFNRRILLTQNNYSIISQKINSLDDCVEVFEKAINNGDTFDDDILKNLSQIKRFKRKMNTIVEILQQKFSVEEITYQKFDNVLNEVEEVLYMNMKSILNKIAAFDIEEYESLQKRNFPPNEVSEEKMNIYRDYISFVQNATKTNEDILLKLDKVLLELSKYDSLEGEQIQELPAITEIDELIKNAKLYK